MTAHFCFVWDTDSNFAFRSGISSSNDDGDDFPLWGIIAIAAFIALCLAAIGYYLGLSKGEQDADTIRLELSEVMKTMRAKHQLEDDEEYRDPERSQKDDQQNEGETRFATWNSCFLKFLKLPKMKFMFFEVF